MNNNIIIDKVTTIENDISIPQRLYNIGITDPAQIKNVITIIYTDPLTNAYNRLYFNDIINRTNIIKNKKTFFGILDIDHFKMVNDTYGHQAGDVVLQKFAEKLKASTEMSVIRYGGEEFMLVAKDPVELHAKIEKARHEISNLVFISYRKEFSINFSAGIGRTPKQADEYLYQAKNAGRAQTRISPDIEKKIDKKQSFDFSMPLDNEIDFFEGISYSR
ncbi:GGDEF domain-containing protein [Candidatus Dependentiae bacterium]|nr:GGDEF domain-containing protein [Candidatus Dependentiae bacterium]